MKIRIGNIDQKQLDYIYCPICHRKIGQKYKGTRIVQIHIGQEGGVFRKDNAVVLLCKKCLSTIVIEIDVEEA